MLPSAKEIRIWRWNASSYEQNESEIFSLICIVVNEINEGEKIKINIVWNIEIRFDWILFNIIFFEIKSVWSLILLNLISFNSPWR